MEISDQFALEPIFLNSRAGNPRTASVGFAVLAALAAAKK